MIVVYHNKNKVIEITNVNSSFSDIDNRLSISEFLVSQAQKFPDEILLWCHINFKEELNFPEIEDLFHHKKLILSYNPSNTTFLGKSIGYVEESPFININKKVTYPTWQMSSMVGGIYGSTLLAIKKESIFDKDLDYFLCSLAKLAMPEGLLCYSEPSLLKQKGNENDFKIKKINNYILFRFVKQHYKTRWIYLLLLNLLVHERKFPIIPFLVSLWYKSRNISKNSLNAIKVQSSRKVIETRTIDIIIPTIGRKKYLYNVLKDLSKQTQLPVNVIIVEQNPLLGSVSELDYLQNSVWPFEIKHTFTHQSGVCNARNIALNQIESEWVFLADDDNRFNSSLLEDIFKNIKKYGNEVVTTAYPQKNEYKLGGKIIQWPTFGGGNSFVKSDIVKKVKFNVAMEFGYGEDADFGMQLRNQGIDVLYFPEPEILHLKAPIGGFRTKPILLWQKDAIQPKPSPTIMLFQILHKTQEQISGYKTILFFKYYKHQKIKNPFVYFINFRKQWKRSVFWANELNNKQ